MGAHPKSRLGPLTLVVTLLALWQSASLYKSCRNLQEASENHRLHQRILHILELSQNDPSSPLRAEFEALLSQISHPTWDVATLESPSAMAEAQQTLEHRLASERDTLQLEWLEVRERIGLTGLLWLAATLLAFFRPRPLKQAAETPPEKPRPNVPLSVTHMAVAAQNANETPTQTSVRGYTDRVLRALSNLLILTGPDGSVQMVNDAVCSTLGYTRGELLGTPYEKLAFSQQTSIPPGTRNLETSFVSKNGKAVPVLVSCSAVYREDDKIEGLVIVAQDISERKETERSLKESEQRLRALMERLVTAQEDERRNVARDLHDGMLQLVIASEMQLTVVKKKMDPLGEQQGLSQGIEYLSEAVKEGRRLIQNLRPPALDKFGLVQSVRQEAIKLSREVNCLLDFESDIENLTLPASLETSIFRICQEAMNNIRKYARPGKISITMTSQEGRLLVRVEDDGKGFDAEAPGFESGVGLHSMRERAEMHGGELQVESRPGGGTVVTAGIPLE